MFSSAAGWVAEASGAPALGLPLHFAKKRALLELGLLRLTGDIIAR